MHHQEHHTHQEQTDNSDMDPMQHQLQDIRRLQEEARSFAGLMRSGGWARFPAASENA